MGSYTAQGHLVGMLDRDQRTAKIRSCDRLHVQQEYSATAASSSSTHDGVPPNAGISHQSIPRRTSPHSSCKTRKNGHFWKSLRRLKHALIVGTYLSLFTFPSILSAPTKRLTLGRMDSVNGESSKNLHDFQNIKALAVDFRDNAEESKENFVRTTFHKDAGQLHNEYKGKDYEWMPKIPKELGEKVPQEHLDTLEYNETLLQVSAYLQTIAVGLHQVVLDQNATGGKFEKAFGRMETDLHTLLREITSLIKDKGLNMEKIPPEIMTKEFRIMDDTARVVRDWIIYRDYMNVLEYVVQAFEHFIVNNA